MVFEWDERKSAYNRRVHGIDFEEAVRVFDDANALRFLDPCTDEERWNIIGSIGRLVFVVYTERAGGVTRLISARLATKKEIDGYYKGYFRRG